MRFDRLLAGTALSLVIALGTAASADPAGSPAVDELVPVTPPAEMVIIPADVPAAAASTATPTQAAPAPATTTSTVPPEPSTEPAHAAVPASTPSAEQANAPASNQGTTPTPSDSAATAPAPAKNEAAGQAPAKTETAVTTPAGGEPAATGSIPVAPLNQVLTLDQQAGEKIRDLIARKDGRQFDGKTRTALDAFYGNRNHAPLWSDNGALNERAKSVAAQLKAAAADGLDPSDYPVPQLKAEASADDIAKFELDLDASVLAYARHAAVGRVHWSRISSDIVYTLTPPDAAEVLGKIATAADPGAVLGSYQPQHREYQLLKAKLAEIRGSKSEGARIGYGPVLKVGMQDMRVPALRERLGVAGEGTSYDKALSDAVKKFQKQRELAASGTLTTATIDAMNGPRNDRAADIIVANMERWRWIPHDLGKAHVIVNIPEYVLRVYNDGAQVWQTRVVVGKPDKATPLLSETMKYITVNPTWNVPPSIVYNEYLPALQQDPTVLSRMGLNVSTNRDGSVHISQPPGAGNALGRIRFNFPNKFLVYQHDTPDKYLFAHDRRAYSHGCMRVQEPDKYAEVLLNITLPKEHYTAERIRRMYGSGEMDIKFPDPIPVHLTYQTAFVDQNGKLVLRDDIYGRDARTIAALKSSDERKFADTPVEHRVASVSSARRQQFRAMPPQPQQQSSGFNFFGLFR